MIACKRNYSEPAASTKMIQTSTTTIVYQRKRQLCTEPNDRSISTIRSEEALITDAKRGFNVACVNDDCSSSKSNLELNSASTPTIVYQRKRQQCTEPNDRSISAIRSEEALITDAKRGFNDACVNDDCSSSKSNLELNSAPLKITDVDDLGECSCSDELITEKVLDEISEKDKWTLILKSKGVLDRVRNGIVLDSGVTSESYCSKACKTCEHLESTEKMIICDNCEGAFHVSCSRPCVTRIPVGEWFCSSCLLKKHKILNDKSISKVDRIGGSEEGDLGSLGFMFRDTETYVTSVLIGGRFQVNVPEWSGPVNHYHRGYDHIGDPVAVHPANNLGLQEWNSTKPQKLSFIGNWLQCREVIRGTGQQDVDGSVCGKWRRAPLFEMQSDDWDCFSSVLWNPAYADCAVPQELETEEVMKQLKYAEMMRPKLAGAKRRKLRRAKSNGS